MKPRSEVEQLEERLLELFKLDNGFVVALYGEWGIGKTFFWNYFVEQHLAKQLQNKEVVYVSLFGKDTLKDIQTDIIIQISKFGKIYESMTSVIGTTKYYGVDISSVLSLATKKDFSDIVICFDDFERKSDKLDFKDILGLVSQLKEQKNCKIVMIYNKNKIEENDKDNVVSNYKDKIIDYELHYKPTVEESYKTISSHLKVFNKYPLNYFKKKGINNIRVMKRIINSLNDFEFIAKKVSQYSDIESELTHTIIEFSSLNAVYHDFSLTDLEKYMSQKSFSDRSDRKTNKEYEDMLYLLDINSSEYLFISDLMQNIDYYIKHSMIDKEGLIQIIDEKILQYKNNELIQKIHSIYSRFNYNLQYDKTTFSKDLFEALKEGGQNIVSLINAGNFVFYMEELSSIENKQEYKDFTIKRLKYYLDKQSKKGDLSKLNTFGELTKIKNYDPDIEKYIDTLENSSKHLKTNSMEEIISLLQRPIQNGAWGNEPELLAMIDKETYKQYMVVSADFFQELITFIRWTQKFSNGSGFEKAVDKIMEAMLDLEKTNELYSYKIKKVLKHLNLDTNQGKGTT